MARYTDEELLNLDFDQVGRDSASKKRQADGDLMADVADILALLEEDRTQEPPRTHTPEVRERRFSREEPQTAAHKAKKAPRAKKEKKPLTPREKQEKVLTILIWVQGAVAACMALGVFLWMR